MREGPYLTFLLFINSVCEIVANNQIVKYAPLPQNLAAVRTAASGVVLSEKVWLLVQKMKGSKTRAKPAGN